MTKICTLSVTCLYGRYLFEDYRFVLAMPAESTLDQLASSILRTCNFDGDHLADFYMANNPTGGRRIMFTSNGEWDGDSRVHETRLCDVFPLEKHKKLYYRYDLGASWIFQIARKGREKDAVAGQAYPYLVLEEGVKPLEYGSDEDDEA